MHIISRLFYFELQIPQKKSKWQILERKKSQLIKLGHNTLDDI